MPIYPTPANLSGVTGIMEYANTVTGNMYGYMILISTFIAGFLWLINKGYDPAESAASVSFITVLMGVFLVLAGIIDKNVMYISVSMMVISTAWLYLSKK